MGINIGAIQSQAAETFKNFSSKPKTDRERETVTYSPNGLKAFPGFAYMEAAAGDDNQVSLDEFSRATGMYTGRDVMRHSAQDILSGEATGPATEFQPTITEDQFRSTADVNGDGRVSVQEGANALFAMDVGAGNPDGRIDATDRGAFGALLEGEESRADLKTTLQQSYEGFQIDNRFAQYRAAQGSE